MKVSDTLIERARRHGLRREVETRPLWADNIPHACPHWVDSDGKQYLWYRPQWNTGAALWIWGAPSGGVSVSYPEEAPALVALLDWLDLRSPECAWRPDTDPIAEALELLKKLQGRLHTLEVSRAQADALVLDTVVIMQKLKGLTYTLRDVQPEALLDIALDLSLQNDELSLPLKRALIRGVRLWPDIVMGAKIAGPWRPASEGVWERTTIGKAETSGDDAAAEINDTGASYQLRVDGEWWSYVFTSREEAAQAADRALVSKGWKLCGEIPREFCGARS